MLGAISNSCQAFSQPKAVRPALHCFAGCHRDCRQLPRQADGCSHHVVCARQRAWAADWHWLCGGHQAPERCHHTSQKSLVDPGQRCNPQSICVLQLHSSEYSHSLLTICALQLQPSKYFHNSRLSAYCICKPADMQLHLVRCCQAMGCNTRLLSVDTVSYVKCTMRHL